MIQENWNRIRRRISSQFWKPGTGRLHLRVKLKTFETPNGLRGELLVPAGIKPREIAEAINQDSRGRWRRLAIEQGKLFTDDGMDTAQTEDKVYEFAIRKDLSNKLRREQADLLRDEKMEFTKRWILTIAAGIHRLKHGFPPQDIGTPRDRGDLFKGMIVRAGGGSLITYDEGVYDYYSDGGDPRANVLPAASPL